MCGQQDRTVVPVYPVPCRLDMNIQIYALKKNFDVQKAERFFKERRIVVQAVDLKKHRLGEREVQLFARAAGGVYQLVDRESTRVKGHPVAYTTDEKVILEYLLADPSLMRLPVVRCGNRVTVGADEEEWKKWTENDH